MANMVFVNSDTLEDIADAIRAKKSVSTHYKPSEMAAAIESINTGGDVTLVSKTITENGTYDPSDDNADGYSEAIVNVPGPTLVNKVITTNGTYDPADDNADGYSGVTVNVGGIPAPYKVASGSFSVAADSRSVSIDISSSGITSVTYLLVLCDDYTNWSKYSDLKRVIVRFYGSWARRTLSSGSDGQYGITEINANGNLENWNALSASLSNGIYTIGTSRTDVTMKPGITYNYIIVGV